MARRSRRNHAPAFKAKVALVAVKGEGTLALIFVPLSKKQVIEVGRTKKEGNAKNSLEKPL